MDLKIKDKDLLTQLKVLNMQMMSLTCVITDHKATLKNISVSPYPTLSKRDGSVVGKNLFSSSKKVNEFQNMEKEPQHDKTNKMTYASSEDSNQAGYPSPLISLRCPH